MSSLLQQDATGPAALQLIRSTKLDVNDLAALELI